MNIDNLLASLDYFQKITLIIQHELYVNKCLLDLNSIHFYIDGFKFEISLEDIKYHLYNLTILKKELGDYFEITSKNLLNNKELQTILELEFKSYKIEQKDIINSLIYE